MEVHEHHPLAPRRLGRVRGRVVVETPSPAWVLRRVRWGGAEAVRDPDPVLESARVRGAAGEGGGGVWAADERRAGDSVRGGVL